MNGIERVLYKILPQNVARGSSVLLRLGNNFLGARLWMVMASVTGVGGCGLISIRYLPGRWKMTPSMRRHRVVRVQYT